MLFGNSFFGSGHPVLNGGSAPGAERKSNKTPRVLHLPCCQIDGKKRFTFARSAQKLTVLHRKCGTPATDAKRKRWAGNNLWLLSQKSSVQNSLSPEFLRVLHFRA